MNTLFCILSLVLPFRECGNIERERGLKIVAEQKICNVHGFDPLIVAVREIIRHQHIFRVVVVNSKQPFIFPLFRFGGLDSFCHLNIQLFRLSCGNKINLPVRSFADSYRIAAP